MPLSIGDTLIAKVQAMPLGRGKNELIDILTSIMDAITTGATVTAADNGTNQTLTAAMVIGGVPTIHVSTGGATPSLTLPLATDWIAALPQWQVGEGYTLRIVNRNSGIATIVTNTGITTSGTLTLAANTWREFVVVKTSPTTLTVTAVGTGTDS